MTEPTDLGLILEGFRADLTDYAERQQTVLDKQDEKIAAEKADRKRSGRRLVIAVVFNLILTLVCVDLARYAICNTNRSKAVTGPATERVTDLIAAFTASLKGPHAPLSDQQRAADIAFLAPYRKQFPVIPDPAKLAKVTPDELLIYVNAVRSVEQDADYQAALKHHPVCSLWSGT